MSSQQRNLKNFTHSHRSRGLTATLIRQSVRTAATCHRLSTLKLQLLRVTLSTPLLPNRKQIFPHTFLLCPTERIFSNKVREGTSLLFRRKLCQHVGTGGELGLDVQGGL